VFSFYYNIQTHAMRFRRDEKCSTFETYLGSSSFCYRLGVFPTDALECMGDKNCTKILKLECHMVPMRFTNTPLWLYFRSVRSSEKLVKL
jgi:hypothetical protein